MNYRKLLILLTAVALAACQGPAGENGVDGIAGDKGDQGDQGAVGETGDAGDDLAAPGAAIAAVAPNALLVGRTTTLRVVGYFTNWDETTMVRFTDTEDNAIEGVEVATVAVSPVGLVVTATVAETAVLGAVKMHVMTGDAMQHYAPEGAAVTITANATANQTELQAGEEFDILIETAEFMLNPTVDSENCTGIRVPTLSRYSQYKFRLQGFTHPAASLGDCALRLVQDADTDDVWSSGLLITITAPTVTTFNEGINVGELTPERNFRTISINAGAGEVVSVRHTVDEANNLDGTGTPLWVFVEGNLEPIADHDGGDSWLEIGNVEARELLLVTQDMSLSDGDDNVSVSLSIITPNTTITALQDGATQDQRLPQNGDGANEQGRSSWYSITNESGVWATLAVAAADDTVLQSRFVIYHDDAVIVSGETGYVGVLPAGTLLLRVWDDESAETDGVLSFALELTRNALMTVDENGAGSGTLQSETENKYLIDTLAGQVMKITATREGEGDAITLNAYWPGNDVAVATGTDSIYVPSAADGNLLIVLSLDGDLGEGVAYGIQVESIETTAFVIGEGASGNAPESGSVWFMGSREDATFMVLNLTPGNADHLQPSMSLYAANGSLTATAEAASLNGATEGVFFVRVSDTEFVAEQDQSFTLNGLPSNLAACIDDLSPLSVQPNNAMTWSQEGTLVGAENPLEFSTSVSIRYALAVTEPSTLDAFVETGFDTRLFLIDGCTFGGGPLIAYNDDGNDWNGVRLDNGGSGINGIALEPGIYTMAVTTYSRWTDPGPFTLHYRLQAQ